MNRNAIMPSSRFMAAIFEGTGNDYQNAARRDTDTPKRTRRFGSLSAACGRRGKLRSQR
jgi:hypothetical protein